MQILILGEDKDLHAKHIYIAGNNIRTYVIGNCVYSAEIRTGAVDFRDDIDLELIPLKVPPEIERMSIAIARSLLLEWTAIDWRRNNHDEYYFLEANPSPMFTYFEAKTGYPYSLTPIPLSLTNFIEIGE
jgi:glutathione synthase/RimK-type ligase-like ATP-grasp enzyme